MDLSIYMPLSEGTAKKILDSHAKALVKCEEILDCHANALVDGNCWPSSQAAKERSKWDCSGFVIGLLYRPGLQYLDLPLGPVTCTLASFYRWEVVQK